MVKKNEYPAFRVSVLRVLKSQIQQDLATHNANMSQLLEDGNYEVITASIQDSASEMQIVVVLQKRAE